MCDTKTRFARHGVRCTKQRLELYKALAAAENHPTAEELHDVVNGRAGSMSLATVYNTLETFCRQGLCRKLPMCCGKARYDANLSEHLHLITSDGRIQDVPEDLGARIVDALPKQLVRDVERRMGVRIGRVDIDFRAAAPPPEEEASPAPQNGTLVGAS